MSETDVMAHMAEPFLPYGLWHVSRADVVDYGEFISAIVRARTDSEAVRHVAETLSPYAGISDDGSNLQAEPADTASRTAGILLASYASE